MEHPATPTDLNSPDRGANQSAEFKEALAKGYEPHDLHLKPVFMFIAGLVVTLVVVLFAIYAIMMAIAAHDRSTDAIQSPVAVKLPPVYAPLQPSLGFYAKTDEEHHAKDHDVLDWQDMEAMRYKAQVALTTYGENKESGRKWEPITVAMADVLPKLVTKPVIRPTGSPILYPPGSYEGVYNLPESRPKPIDPALNPNDLHRLNNLGN